MDQLRLGVSDLLYLTPELTLVISAIIMSLIDLALPRRFDRNWFGWLALAGIVISTIFVIGQIIDLSAAHTDGAANAQAIQLLNQSYRVDDFANFFKLLFLVGTGLIVFMSIGSMKEKEVPYIGEYYYLLLPATLGAMIMASSGDLITLFVGLELLSITSYILVGMRKRHLHSTEGAFKYLVLGGISSAFVLYGMSFLYGIAGTTNIVGINAAITENLSSFEGLIYISFFLMLTGFGFKIAAAPFHSYAPDVYQGAPTPVTAFLAVVTKGAGLAILFRIVYSIFYGVGSAEGSKLSEDVFLSLFVLAATAMIVGTALALKQRNMKRLLAYSGVANAGYLLVPLATQFSFFHYSNFSEMFFYLVAYLFMNIGAFAVLMAVSAAEGHDEVKGFAGLYYRAPYTAAAMVILLLSLSGLPITGGFFGKLYILLGTLQLQNYWLAIIMIVTSAVSFYYYFSIIRQMYLRTSGAAHEIKLTAPLAITIWICAIATVLLGIFPQWVLNYLEGSFSLIEDFFIR